MVIEKNLLLTDGEQTPSAPRDSAQPDKRAQNDEGAARIYKRKKGDQRGGSPKAITNAIQAAQAAYLAKENKTIAELAKDFDLVPKGARRRVDQKEILSIAKDIIAERLLPKALAILNKELNEGNYAAAKDILFGSQVLEKGGKATIEHVSKSSILEDVRKEIIDIEGIDVTHDEGK